MSMSLSRRAVTSAGLAALGAAAARLPAQAQGAPTTRFVVGFPAGGFIDGVARIVSEGVKSTLGGTIIVEVKTGAGGQLAVMDVKGAKPDGSALLVTPAAPITIYPHSYEKLSYAPAKDLSPVALIASFDLAVIVGADHPAKTPAELAKWYRDYPGRSGFGTPGAGSGPHFSAFEILRKLGADTPLVHYRGDPPQVQDILANALPAGIVVTSVAHRNKEKLRVLAVSGSKRNPMFPDAPTLREAGIDTVVEEWLGVFTTGGTPPETVARINAAINGALGAPETVQRLGGLGLVPTPSTPPDFARRIAADTERWSGVVKASGFKAE